MPRVDLQADFAAEGVDGVFDDGETKAGPRPALPAAGGIDLVKPLENAIEVLGGDSDAGVGDCQGDDARGGFGLMDGNRPPSRRWA